MITLGADVELLAFQDKQLRSVIDRIGGTKEYPLLVEGGNLQEDNVLAEFAIDPVQSRDAWINSILSVREQLQIRLANLELQAMPSARFPDEELLDYRAQEFGCDPDLNAWTFQYNPPPDPHEVGNLRTCGGHIHVGWSVEEGDMVARAKVIQWMDVYLGLPSVLLDNDSERRAVYGKAGACRFKEYGVEYRTLSNFWTQNQELMGWAYDATHRAYERAQQELVIDAGGEDVMDDIQEAINNSDDQLALQIMNDLQVDYGIAA